VNEVGRFYMPVGQGGRVWPKAELIFAGKVCSVLYQKAHHFRMPLVGCPQNWCVETVVLAVHINPGFQQIFHHSLAVIAGGVAEGGSAQLLQGQV
jgi:hypothetical protein